VVARLAEGEAVAALAREFGTSRQSIMRIRQAYSPETHITKPDTQ
jgi:transposase-like protein